MTAMAMIPADSISGVRSALAEKRERIERLQPLQRMAELLDEWAKWSRHGGGLGLGCARNVSAEQQAAAMYCISDDDAIAVERCLAILKVHHRRYWEIVHRRHWDDFSFHIISIAVARSKTQVQNDYWLGVGEVRNNFEVLRKKC